MVRLLLFRLLKAFVYFPLFDLHVILVVGAVIKLLSLLTLRWRHRLRLINKVRLSKSRLSESALGSEGVVFDRTFGLLVRAFIGYFWFRPGFNLFLLFFLLFSLIVLVDFRDVGHEVLGSRSFETQGLSWRHIELLGRLDLLVFREHLFLTGLLGYGDEPGEAFVRG